MSGGFSEIIHVPTRLRICSILAEAGESEFAVLRDALSLSDKVLSKHVKVLDQAGFARVRKGSIKGRTRTWVSLTKDGQTAFTAHVHELRKFAAPGNKLIP